MLIKKNQSIKKSNSKNCTVWEYPTPSKLMTGATALINGRYPDSGRAANMECEEIYYVISGTGIIHSDKGDFKIEEGDQYFFEKKEKYFVEGKKLFIFLVNAPQWTLGQYKSFK